MSEASVSVPAGLLIRASGARLARDFSAAAELQPVAWTEGGLLCSPRAAEDPRRARAALTALDHPHEFREQLPGWPEPPSAWVAGWYRRSPAHAPAPSGVRELIQTPGEGFGPAGHPTTALCLSLLTQIPTGPALDAGCGSGLLAQAWLALGGGDVLAVDLDERALRQCRESLAAAGRAGQAEVRRKALAALDPEDLADRVLLANVPAAAHHELLPRIGEETTVAVIAGPGAREMGAVVSGYSARGLHERLRVEDGRWSAVVVARP